jgi:hypothetical protein
MMKTHFMRVEILKDFEESNDLESMEASAQILSCTVPEETLPVSN